MLFILFPQYLGRRSRIQMCLGPLFLSNPRAVSPQCLPGGRRCVFPPPSQTVRRCRPCQWHRPAPSLSRTLRPRDSVSTTAPPRPRYSCAGVRARPCLSPSPVSVCCSRTTSRGYRYGVACISTSVPPRAPRGEACPRGTCRAPWCATASPPGPCWRRPTARTGSQSWGPISPGEKAGYIRAALAAVSALCRHMGPAPLYIPAGVVPARRDSR